MLEYNPFVSIKRRSNNGGIASISGSGEPEVWVDGESLIAGSEFLRQRPQVRDGFVDFLDWGYRIEQYRGT